MRRSRPCHVAASSERRGGLALPTAVAAAVCGGSVLVVALSGAFALDGRESAPIQGLTPAGVVADPTLRSGSPLDAAARTAVPSRSAGVPSAPTVASTAGEHTVTDTEVLELP